MNNFVVRLIKKYNKKTYDELYHSGIVVTWSSKVIPALVHVETNKDIEEVKQHPLIMTAYVDNEGELL